MGGLKTIMYYYTSSFLGAQYRMDIFLSVFLKTLVAELNWMIYNAIIHFIETRKDV